MGFQVTAPTLMENFDTIGDWTITGGSASVVADSAFDGEALRLTSGVGTNCIATKTVSLDFSTSPRVVMYVFIGGSDLTGTNNLQFILTSSTTFVSFFSKTVSASGLHEGLNKLVLGRDEWGQGSGTNEDWANTMVRLRVRINALASSAPSVYFVRMETGYERPVVSISFDDSWDSVYTEGYSHMRKYRMPGIVFAVSSFFDQANRMTTGQHDTMYKDGWDICNHTFSHEDLETLSLSDQVDALQKCRDALIARGFTRNNMHRHVAFPFGNYNYDTLIALSRIGALTGRTTIDRTQAHLLDNNKLLTHFFVQDTVTLADAKAEISKTISSGGMIEMNFHKLVATPASNTEWPISDFQLLIDHIQRLRLGNVIDVMTRTEWYQRLNENRKPVTYA